MTQPQALLLPGPEPLQTQPVTRQEWKEFLEQFTRRHEGWLTGLRIRERDGGAETVIARQLPLVDVHFDEEGKRIWIHLGTGKNARVLHPLKDPIFLQVDVGDDGAEWGLEIDYEHGTALLRFRSSLPALMVDGIAPLPS